MLLNGENNTGKVVPFAGNLSEPVANAMQDNEAVELVRALRVLWRRTQLRGRDDFDRACLLIAGDEETTVERYATAFFQGAQIYARRRLRFFNAKSDVVSEDEMWLARLLLSLHRGDFTSVRYLMALRIDIAGRRRLTFLARGLAEHLLTGKVRVVEDAE